MFKKLDAVNVIKLAAALGLNNAETFEKSHTQHKAAAAGHEALASHHNAHAAMTKAVHDSLGDSHEMKHCMKASGEHHEAMAAEHTKLGKAHHAMAEGLKASFDQLKALDADFEKGVVTAAPAAVAAVATDPTTPGDAGAALQKMIDDAVQAVSTKALDTLKNSPQIEELVQKMVIARVTETLGKTIVPTQVSVQPLTNAQPTKAAGDGPQLVPRYGQADPKAAEMRKSVDPALRSVILGDEQAS